ncbi:MAG TPA: hypothetical protein VFJ90_06560 [Candidatus Didemnitutus sp.]|nr:hypothetical protein [Candidatus Didemnitutus sp.]
MRNASEKRLLVRVVAVVVAIGAAVTAHAGIRSERQLAAILHRTPAARVVAEGEQMKQAEEAAAALPGAQTFWGVGASMQPLYAPSTAVVVQPIAYDKIKRGMTLVYVTSQGHVVAHSVIDEDGRGYVVQGVNNDRPDRESVNEKNLIGVVVAAYSADVSESRNNLDRQFAAKVQPTSVEQHS